MDNPIDEIIAIDKAARKTVAQAQQKMDFSGFTRVDDSELPEEFR